MHQVPQPRLTLPAVAGRLERGVRLHSRRRALGSWTLLWPSACQKAARNDSATRTFSAGGGNLWTMSKRCSMFRRTDAPTRLVARRCRKPLRLGVLVAFEDELRLLPRAWNRHKARWAEFPTGLAPWRQVLLKLSWPHRRLPLWSDPTRGCCGEPLASSQVLWQWRWSVKGAFCVQPNVRAKLPAEAGFVSPDWEDVQSISGRAYKACRSGSAWARG